MPKYVIVSGRSSHTVTAKNELDARQKFHKLFPYAHVRFISSVPNNALSFRTSRRTHKRHPIYQPKSILDSGPADYA